MTPEQYQQVRSLFEEALNMAPAARSHFLAAACSGDAEILQQVEQLFLARSRSEHFLDENKSREGLIGRYRVTREIGQGSMGVVYEARDPVIHRAVAIKVIPLRSPAGSSQEGFLKERLFREAHLAGSLSHPGIVTIYDLGESDGQAYIAMERVWGPSLDKLMKSGSPLSLSQSMEILRQIASALDYAHARHVVHRDVKPANILLQDGKTAKVVDFGIAKILSAQEQTLTALGAGTPGYMSPEQIEAGSTDGCSDQFSLAVIAFEMLAGAKPFKGDSLASITHSIVYANRPSAHAANRALPATVDAVFLRALKRLPRERYASCSEFVNELALALDGVQALPASQVKRPPARISAMAAGCAGSVFAAAVLALVTAFYSPAWLSPSRPPAKPQPIDSLRIAAEAGDSSSMVKLGDLYSSGDGVDRDAVEATRWYQRAANAGDSQGMVDLGGAYALGSGAAQDLKAAVHWFQAASDLGNASAKFDLGWLYENGQGVPKNAQTATRLYIDAAKLGNDEAKRRLTQLATTNGGAGFQDSFPKPTR